MANPGAWQVAPSGTESVVRSSGSQQFANSYFDVSEAVCGSADEATSTALYWNRNPSDRRKEAQCIFGESRVSNSESRS
jgi:hypothetical protein